LFACVLFGLLSATGVRADVNQPTVRPEIVIRKLAGTISRLTFSSDGRLLVSAGDAVAIWDAVGLRMLRTLDADVDKSVAIEHSVAGFSRDNRYLVAGPSVYRVADGALLRAEKLQDYESDANSFSTSPDGRYAVVTASLEGHHGENRAALVVDFRAPNAPMRIVEITGGSPAWGATCFSADGRMFFGGLPFTAYALTDGRPLRVLKGDYSRVVACAPDGRSFVTAFQTVIDRPEVLELRDTRDGHVIRGLGTYAPYAVGAAYARDSRTIALVNTTQADPNRIVLLTAQGVPVRTLEARLPAARTASPKPYLPDRIEAVAFGPTPNTLAVADWNGDIAYVDARSGALLRAVTARRSESRRAAVAVSPNGHWMAAGLGYRSVVWDLGTGQPALRLDRACTVAAAFSLDSRRLICADAEAIDVWDVTQSTHLTTLRPPLPQNGSAEVDGVAFDPTGARLFVTYAQFDHDRGTVRASVFAIDSGRETRLDDRARGGTIFGIPDDRSTVSWADADGAIQRYDFRREQRETIGHVPGYAASADFRNREAPLREQPYLVQDRTRVAAISSDGRWYAVGVAGGYPTDPNVTLYDVRSGGVVWSRRLDETSVRGFSPDGSTLYLAETCGCHPLLAFSTTPLQPRVAPPPRRLFDDVDGIAFTHDRDLAVTTAADGVRIWNAAENALVGLLYDGSPSSDDWLAVAPSGLFDGTLDAPQNIVWRFNNDTLDYAPPEAFFKEFYEPGLLAEFFNGTVPAARELKDIDRRAPSLTFSLPSTAASSRTVKVGLDVAGAAAQRVDLFRNGTLVATWGPEQLGERTRQRLTADVTLIAGSNRLHAYAFNRDDVRGAVASAVVVGAPSLQRKGVAHVLAVGLDDYENPSFALKFAVADARAFAETLQRESDHLDRYASVDVVTLVEPQSTTKAAILRSLTELARRSAPEDAVYVYFAGHGVRRGGRYYLLPYDVGYRGPRSGIGSAGMEQLLSHAISDLDLARAFASMDAAGIDLVIDACESGGALGQSERVGPMNARGLAQLAYDKGMYVLTAAQSDQAALESLRFGHGLLAYALVERGLVDRMAAPDAPELYARPWLTYAQGAVPVLQAEMMEDAERGGTRLAFVDGEERSIDGAADRHVQRPRLYLPERSGSDDLLVARYR
jgi:WD40 repeat protein